MVSALASHQCGPRSIPALGVKMWVEFVVGSSPYSERFFSGYSSFPLSSKTNISEFQFDLDTVDEEAPCKCTTADSHLLFDYLFIYLVIRATSFYGLTGQEAVHCSPSTVFSTVILKECFLKLLSRESESGLISCCINGVRESLPFDINTFDLRGALQYGDMVRNEIKHHIRVCTNTATFTSLASSQGRS